MRFPLGLACVLAAALALSCGGKGRAAAQAADGAAAKAPAADAAALVLSSALPALAAAEIRGRIDAARPRFDELLAAALADRDADPAMYAPLDKVRALPEGYAPSDLVELDASGLSVSRAGHRLRRAAFEAMKAMDAAARAQGVTLLVSSAYRSYEYQVEVFSRHVREMGRDAALMVSAESGHSQHQLGTAIDFGSISDAFAETAASRWLEANAARFGFSLSFPKGMTAVTGYDWESWHYRYVGKPVAALQAEFFGGIQLYTLRFLENFRK